MSEKRIRRAFTPEQKVSFLQKIESYPTIKKGCEETGINETQYRQWKRQYHLGVKSSLRNSRPPLDPEIKLLREENRILKLTVLNLSAEMADLKKTVSY